MMSRDALLCVLLLPEVDHIAIGILCCVHRGMSVLVRDVCKKNSVWKRKLGICLQLDLSGVDVRDPWGCYITARLTPKSLLTGTQVHLFARSPVFSLSMLVEAAATLAHEPRITTRNLQSLRVLLQCPHVLNILTMTWYKGFEQFKNPPSVAALCVIYKEMSEEKRLRCLEGFFDPANTSTFTGEVSKRHVTALSLNLSPSPALTSIFRRFAKNPDDQGDLPSHQTMMLLRRNLVPLDAVITQQLSTFPSYDVIAHALAHGDVSLVGIECFRLLRPLPFSHGMNTLLTRPEVNISRNGNAILLESIQFRCCVSARILQHPRFDVTAGLADVVEVFTRNYNVQLWRKYVQVMIDQELLAELTPAIIATMQSSPHFCYICAEMCDAAGISRY